MVMALLVLACTGTTPQDSGGDSGLTTGAPTGGCVEVNRAPVTDTSNPAGTLDFAADDALAWALGSFQGTASLVLSTGEQAAVAAAFSVSAEEAVEAVDMEPDDTAGGSDTGPAVGAPGADPAGCPDYYELAASGTLTSSPPKDLYELWLYEIWTGPVVLWSPTSASLSFAKDATEMGGAYQPDFDPTEWDHATLDVSAAGDPKGWTGQLQWSASREVSDGVGKGIVGPAGSFAVAPAG